MPSWSPEKPQPKVSSRPGTGRTGPVERLRKLLEELFTGRQPDASERDRPTSQR
jgi:hypothetical protein